MPGQASEYGAQALGNRMAGLQPAYGSTPPTPVPGLQWIDSLHSNAVKTYNGSAWVITQGLRYLMLLYAPPQDGDALNNLYEIQTAGYTRQHVTFTAPTVADPSIMSNNSLITFGPMTADMTRVATHIALVDSPSGTAGNFWFWWELDTSQQVAASQSIQISTNTLITSLA